eukprot:UC4_evm1s1165
MIFSIDKVHVLFLLSVSQSIFPSSYALDALIPCAEGGRGGRWGLCTDDKKPVVLRGSNYIRLGGPGLNGYHSTFATSVYNRSRYQSVFSVMKSNGYNIQRVFLDETRESGIGGNTTGTTGSALPFDVGYVDRLAQYIVDAETFGIYTIVTMVYTPNNEFFRNATASIPVDEKWNEFFLKGNEYPFDSLNGSVKFADGVEYDMANPENRQQAADTNTNLWATRSRIAIQNYLPSVLVTVGVFTFEAVHKKGSNGLLLDTCRSKPVPKSVDCRFPARPFSLSRTDLDFLDVHIASGEAQDLKENLMTEEWDGIKIEKPIIMGEFGCNTKWYQSAKLCSPNIPIFIDENHNTLGNTFRTWDTHKEQPD